MEVLPEFFICEPVGMQTQEADFFILHTVDPKWLAFVTFEDRAEGTGAKFSVLQTFDGADPEDLGDSVTRAMQALGNDPRHTAKKD